LNSRTQNVYDEQLMTHTFSGEGRGKTVKKRLGQQVCMVYSDSSRKCTRIGAAKAYSDSSRCCTQVGAAKAYSDSSRSCTRIGAQGIIRLRSMIYSNKVYITMCIGVCQAQTQIQEQRVLGSNQKCGALGVRHNVYSDSDWSARV
jgi:hypothetical protein